MSDMRATEALYDVNNFNSGGIDYRGYKHQVREYFCEGGSEYNTYNKNQIKFEIPGSNVFIGKWFIEAKIDRLTDIGGSDDKVTTSQDYSVLPSAPELIE